MTIDEAAAILGIGSDADEASVKRAYRSRSQLLHPDRHASSAQDLQRAAHTAMQQLNEALDVMSSRTVPADTPYASTGRNSPSDPEPPGAGDHSFMEPTAADELVTKYRPGSVMDRMTKGLIRFTDRMERATERVDRFNQRLDEINNRRTG